MITLDDTFALFSSMEWGYAARGLVFDRNELGCVPVQAFGRLDGDHFYFRFRGDRATLRVGPHDEVLEQACWGRSEQVRKEKLAAAEPDSFMWHLLNHSREMAVPGRHYVPTRVTEYARIDDVTGDRYNGSLDLQEFRELYARLVDELEPMAVDNQVDAGTINGLTEGGLWPLPVAASA